MEGPVRRMHAKWMLTYRQQVETGVGLQHWRAGKLGPEAVAAWGIMLSSEYGLCVSEYGSRKVAVILFQIFFLLSNPLADPSH